MKQKLTLALFSVAVIGFISFQMFARNSKTKEVNMETMSVRIPESIKLEHEEIHSTLIEATKAPGRVGEAARELAEVLHPHFVREEEIALPPLGMLAPLADNSGLNESDVSQTLAMTDSLKRELPRMLEEHKRIRMAVENLRVAAEKENNTKYVKLAEQLALHAQSEEEVFYPSAVIVGEVIRARKEK